VDLDHAKISSVLICFLAWGFHVQPWLVSIPPFIVSGSLEHKTLCRWAMVTCWSVSTAMCPNAISGKLFLPLLAFLESTQGNVLHNFERHTAVATKWRQSNLGHDNVFLPIPWNPLWQDMP
jgi:hypothetical protein